MNERKRYWLKKQGTNDVWEWTKVLAARTDMVPVSEDEAMACRKRAEEELANARRTRIEERMIPELKARQPEKSEDESLVPPKNSEKKPKVKALSEMNLDELRGFAKQKKIAVTGDNEDAVRQEILVATGMIKLPDAQPPPVEENAESPEPQEAPFDHTTATQDEFIALSRADLVKAARRYGVVPKGSNDVIAAQIIAVRDAPEQAPATE